MAKIEQNLRELFRNNADNTSIFEFGNSIGTIPSMTEDKFVEIVGNLLAECMAILDVDFKKTYDSIIKFIEYYNALQNKKQLNQE